jgi:aminoglycoside phosphotransferase family enzyme/predicted kinase
MPPHDPVPIAPHDLLDFLLDPRSYPHQPAKTRLIQTHSAYVVIASPYVYKVKKPVNFGFLDFSSLAQRRYFSEREVTLNQRLCPDLYLGVVPISRCGGRLRFGEGDVVVEYAIKMRELSEEGFLARRLERGEADRADIDRIVATLKAFYESHPPTEDILAWGRIDHLRINTDENFRQTEPYIGQTISRPAFEAIRRYTDRFYATHEDLFASRIRDGWIRDGHGDLHLEHIHLGPDTLCIYDCIEFNDRFRYLDVASDVAFLAMDLDYNGRPDLARCLTGAMSEALGDRTMPRLMEFYKGYRAYVRGKVETFRSGEPEVPAPERAASRERAGRYFRLALQYAALGSGLTVIVVMGRSGAGKSTLAARLGEELGWTVLSSDGLRKELAGVPVHGRSSAPVRQWLYAEPMTRRTYRTLFERMERQLLAGHGLILDATFGNRMFRDALRDRLHRMAAACHFIEAAASDAAVKQRLAARDQRPDEISDARLENFDTINRQYAPPEELPPDAYLSVTTETGLNETLTACLTCLVERHVERT